MMVKFLVGNKEADKVFKIALKEINKRIDKLKLK